MSLELLVPELRIAIIEYFDAHDLQHVLRASPAFRRTFLFVGHQKIRRRILQQLIRSEFIDRGLPESELRWVLYTRNAKSYMEGIGAEVDQSDPAGVVTQFWEKYSIREVDSKTALSLTTPELEYLMSLLYSFEVIKRQIIPWLSSQCESDPAAQTPLNQPLSSREHHRMNRALLFWTLICQLLHLADPSTNTGTTARREETSQGADFIGSTFKPLALSLKPATTTLKALHFVSGWREWQTCEFIGVVFVFLRSVVASYLRPPPDVEQENCIAHDNGSEGCFCCFLGRQIELQQLFAGPYTMARLIESNPPILLPRIPFRTDRGGEKSVWDFFQYTVPSTDPRFWQFEGPRTTVPFGGFQQPSPVEGIIDGLFRQRLGYGRAAHGVGEAFKRYAKVGPLVDRAAWLWDEERLEATGVPGEVERAWIAGELRY